MRGNFNHGYTTVLSHDYDLRVVPGFDVMLQLENKPVDDLPICRKGFCSCCEIL